MPILLIVNTVLCAILFLPSIGILTASVMAGASGSDSLGGLIAVLGLVLPATIVVSVLGSWAAHALHLQRLSLVFVALPWLNLLVLGAVLAVYFLQWKG